MSSVSNFQKRFPEFCDEDDSRVQIFLDDCALLMGTPDRWLDFFDVAHEYYTAHFMTVANAEESGDAGVLAPIRKQEVDDVIIEQAIAEAQPTFDELHSTSYGKRFYMYRKICFVGMYGV